MGGKVMRNKKRYWALGLTACMLASVMAGCGSGGGSDSKGSSEGNTDKGAEADAGGTSSDKEVKLTMLGWEIYQQAGMEAVSYTHLLIYHYTLCGDREKALEYRIKALTEYSYRYYELYPLFPAAGKRGYSS